MDSIAYSGNPYYRNSPPNEHKDFASVASDNKIPISNVKLFPHVLEVVH